MQEGKVIDPVKLDLCEYQAIEPTNHYDSAEEDDDNRIEVSPYEALVINDTSKIGAIESPSNPESQQETVTTDQSPIKSDQLLTWNSIKQLEDDYLLYGKYNLDNLEKIIHTVNHLGDRVH